MAMQLRMRELVQEALSVHANVASNIQYQIAVVDVGEPLLGGKSSYASVELGIEHVAEPGRHQGRVGKAFFHAMCSIRQIKRSADVLQLERCLSHKIFKKDQSLKACVPIRTQEFLERTENQDIRKKS